MELEAQRRCSWRAVLAAAAILCGALLVSPPSVEAASPELAKDEPPVYTINLESTPRPADPSPVAERPGLAPYRLYTTSFEKDGQTWHRLRMGFFASEHDARQALEALRAEYPQAWIAKASPGEVAITGRLDTAPSTAAPVPEILTLKEAAEFLRVDPFVLKDMARRQAVPSRRIGVYWRFSRSALHAWLAGADVSTAELFAAAPTVSGAVGQASLGPPGEPQQGEPLSPDAMSRVAAAGTKLAQEETPEAADEVPEEAPEEPIGEAPEERTAEDVFLRGQRVLIAPGEVVLDVGMFYSESDNQQLALVNGGVGLATVETETLTGFIFGRYGLFEETELFASTTYRKQDTDVFVGSQRVTGSHRSEFGDVRLGVRRTVLREAVGRPDVILTLEGRIPTDDDDSSYGSAAASPS